MVVRWPAWCRVSQLILTRKKLSVSAAELQLDRLFANPGSSAAQIAIANHSHYTSASKRSIRSFVITEKDPTRAFSWLKAATTAFTFKTLFIHYAKRVLTQSK